MNDELNELYIITEFLSRNYNRFLQIKGDHLKEARQCLYKHFRTYIDHKDAIKYDSESLFRKHFRDEQYDDVDCPLYIEIFNPKKKEWYYAYDIIEEEWDRAYTDAYNNDYDNESMNLDRVL